MGQDLAQIGAFQLENWLVSAGESGRRQEGAQGWRGEVEVGGLIKLSIAREPKSHHQEGLSCSISQALSCKSHLESLNR